MGHVTGRITIQAHNQAEYDDLLTRADDQAEGRTLVEADEPNLTLVVDLTEA